MTRNHTVYSLGRLEIEVYPLERDLHLKKEIPRQRSMRVNVGNPADSWRMEKMQFQPKKAPMDISEKNETKVLHRITFRASNIVNGKSVSAVAMKTVQFQNGRKLTFNPIYFANEFGTPIDLFFCIKTFLLV